MVILNFIGMKNNKKFYRDQNENSLTLQGLKIYLGLIFMSPFKLFTTLIIIFTKVPLHGDALTR